LISFSPPTFYQILDAIASSESVRVAPSLRSQKGAVWTKSKTSFDWWEVDIAFRISGRGRIGADGLAFWYTTEKGDYNGEVFGSSDKWNGLAIFFDSFDNDNKHNNPYIMAVINDGQRKFDHQNDGHNQALAGCLRDFRNKPFPTRAKIEYYNNVLTVLFHSGMTNNEQDYEMCLRAENVVLPKYGHFGISAATGGLADDHDVFHLLTTSLYPPGAIDTIGQVQASENEKISQEYQEYQQKLDRQKEEYKKEHPDEQKDDMEDWFESDNQRELRQIWQAQTSTAEILRELSRKLDEVLGRQERTLGLISASGNQVQTGGSGGVPPPQHQQQQQQYNTGGDSGIRRQEVDNLINTQNILVQSIRDLKSQLNDLNQRSELLISNQKQGGSQGGAFDMHSLVTEMRDGMNQVKMSVAGVQARVNQPQPLQSCPSSSCLGLTPFLIAIAVHLVIILGYSIYRDAKGNQSKKFY
jgi:mannose-binding lectin 1